MRKKILIVMSVLLVVLAILIIGTSLDEPLSPSVEQALKFKVPEVAPEDNAYVGLSGLRYINDGDVVAAGLKFLNKDLPKDAPSAPALDLDYKNPCLIRGDSDCLDQIVADAEAINQAVLKNKKILERYQTVLKMPRFVNTGTDFSSPVPNYQPMVGASRLVGAKTLLDIKQNGLAAGLDSLEMEFDFYKRICQSEYVGLIELMVANAVLTMDLIKLSKIIEDGQIDISGHEDRLRKMLDLDLKADRMMAAALNKEKREFLQIFDSDAGNWGSWTGDDSPLKDRLENMLQRFLYKRNMTLNRLAAKFDVDIKRFQAAPLLNFPEFYHQNKDDLEGIGLSEADLLDFKRLYKEYGLFYFKNRTGEIMLNMAKPLYITYMARINDTLVHARLIRAQLELRLMDPRPDNIPEALAGLGPETWNPYTGQPFVWDEEKKVLRAESAAAAAATLHGGEESGRIMEVRLPDQQP